MIRYNKCLERESVRDPAYDVVIIVCMYSIFVRCVLMMMCYLHSVKMLLFDVAVTTKHRQLVPAVAVTAFVSNGAQLADEHSCSDTQHPSLSLLSVCFHWFVTAVYYVL